MACIGKKKSILLLSLIVVASLFAAVFHYTLEAPPLFLQLYFGQAEGLNNRRIFSDLRIQQSQFLPGYISVTTQQPLRLNCNTCSIVSSSGQMLGQKMGQDIDQSTCVWRMNNAPSKGFETDVGTRTTVRVVSHTSVPLLFQKQQYFFGEANDTVYVIWGPYRNMRQDGKGIIYNMLWEIVKSYPHAKIYVTTEDRMNHCDRIFKRETGKDRVQSGSYLSTGWFTLVLAMDVCHKIHIYGMINATHCSLHRTEGYKRVPYHYYEAGSRDECTEYFLHENAPYGGHRFITEKSVFAKWAKQHNMTFSHPMWSLS
uniref:alpha-N-acetylneuraminyl-2,3-beta-galactosyl-1,3-N-acetylgalactosaminide6-alpha-sialyltransferase n=1 Tax=Callorhinchus milii TaxID=7868 RepID=A0A4W3HU88_CALMI